MSPSLFGTFYYLNSNEKNKVKQNWKEQRKADKLIFYNRPKPASFRTLVKALVIILVTKKNIVAKKMTG
jgi:hypothetical protein